MVNESGRTNPTGAERLASGAARPADWTDDVELLRERLRDLRRAAAALELPLSRLAPGTDSQPQPPGANTGKSMLESLAYAQAIHIRHERPKREPRKGRRPTAFETTLGSDPMPDAGWKNREHRGQS